MNDDLLHSNDPRLTAAVSELRQLIERHYPGATFRLSGGDDPEGVWLIVTVDVDDPDVVVDLVIDRLLTLQINDRLPLYVLPVRSSSRLADMYAQLDRRMGKSAPTPALSSSQA